MKILLAGGSGQLAQELQPILLSVGEVISVDRTSVDLSQPETIRQAMADIQPDVVVNAAAYTAVDKAETEADLAEAVNGIAPGIFAEECEKLGASLIHFSTDYVFDGSSGSAYLETDSTNPLGIYGKSKLAGEEAIRKAGNRHIIIRTTLSKPC
jgi:dTDP-4-dehydrorhamnose reductase